MEKKKLIEVALPLEAINEASTREKSIRHGHPSTLHLWWARRPLAAARAVIWASLVDDPSAHPEQFPTEAAQAKERERLFGILERLVVWENSNNPDVLREAKAEIMKSTDNNPPELLDPFAGGGAIPLEAQRLGLKAHAHDLNPVAVMINKAMIEIPARFADFQPVNPEANRLGRATGYVGPAGLAEDVRYYGEWMKQEAFKRIGHLYPKVKLPEEQGGGEMTVIAWIWARTVKCPNPACGCEMPLVRSFELTKKAGRTAWIEARYDDKNPKFKIHYHGKAKIRGTINRKGGICPNCSTVVEFPYIRDEGKNNRIENRLMAIVCEGNNGRIFVEPILEHERIARISRPIEYPSAVIPRNARDFKTPNYGLNMFEDLFTNRQLTALVTFSDLIEEVKKQVEKDYQELGLPNDDIGLAKGGVYSRAYSESISVYLQFLVDKLTDYHSNICSWHATMQCMRNVFGRQAIPMTWDFAEGNFFCSSTGSYSNMLQWIYKSVLNFPGNEVEGEVKQFNAQNDCGLRNIMVSTDPPYYDNIGYADLSDFFYIWMRRSLRNIYPNLFSTMLVPKNEELIATPYRHDGGKEEAKTFFEEGMLETCRQIEKYTRDDIPVTIYYAYKQSEVDEDDATASTGWETMLSSIIKAGLSITGTWPIRTEMANRTIASGANALASSIVLVCRKRPDDAQITTRRNFINELKRELKPALQKLQQSNIAPVDMAQSAIGPGMAVFSKYQNVLEADGSPMTVRSALQIINQELDLFFNEQDGELDSDSRFCVDLYTQTAFNDISFGTADTLARAKNTSVAVMQARGLLFAEKGYVHLLSREDLPDKVNKDENNIWLLMQQLTRAMEKGGIEACAKIVAPIFGANAERAKALAYRLYTIAEKKGWAQEAYAYNSLVVAWPEIQARAAEQRKIEPKQMSFSDWEN